MFEANTVYTTSSVEAARQLVFEGADPSDPTITGMLEPVTFKEFEPEKVSTFEIGYKSLLGGNIFFDAYYYYSSYQDFIAEIDFVQAVPNGLTQDPTPFDANTDQGKQEIIESTVATQRYGFDVNADGNVESHGWAAQAEYSITKGYVIGGNVAWNQLISQDDLTRQGFQANYNTPEWRWNIVFKNREVIPNFGFNVTYRWQDAFFWEASFGAGVIAAFGTLDAQVSYKIPSIKSVVKIGAMNLTNERYTTGFGNPRMGGVYYLSLVFDEFFN